MALVMALRWWAEVPFGRDGLAGLLPFLLAPTPTKRNRGRASGPTGEPFQATAWNGGGASAEPRLAPGPSRVQTQAATGPSRCGALPVQGKRPSRPQERGDQPLAFWLGGGRNVRTARAVRNSAGASPKCAALGNARGAALCQAMTGLKSARRWNAWPGTRWLVFVRKQDGNHRFQIIAGATN